MNAVILLSTANTVAQAGVLMIGAGSLLVAGVITTALWKTFEKAGEPGWAALVPIYNTLTLLRIVDKPWWWVLLLLIPYVNLIILVWVLNLLGKRFGKTEGFTVGLLFLPFIFYPQLAWGEATFQRPAQPAV
ncbi:DUF5684 domain-containing protein [Larkinella terrae]|uniref:Signal peptidase I n=1 Tax=Larkinella terrae TaxID=2025311 RepID=A0A7K0ENX8_9BACT|nr:DUF5684 domain-containing protein [Larkinella terrae]MRS63494.1 hypothetical protein [Larkinella terrae]